MNDPSPEKLKLRRRIRSTIVFQFALVCGLVAAALVLVPLFMYYAGMLPEVHERDFADSPVQHAIDTYSLQAEGNITTLERIINKELNVPVTTNEEGNLVVEYEGTRTILDDSYILSEEPIKEPMITAEFGSVEELTASDGLAEGGVVRTTSFYAGSGRGGATYDVVARTNETQPDDMSRLGLANGLVAVIRPQNGMVSVDQLGAHADNATDDYPYIQAAVDLGYKAIAFEGGDYRLGQQLELRHSNLTILGNGATLRYGDGLRWNLGSGDGDYVVGIHDRSAGTLVENVYLQALNLSDERTGETGPRNEFNMVRMSNVEHIELYECNLNASDHSVTDKKIPATNLDVRTYWHDVIIDSCQLINTTYADQGGTIWVRGGTEGTGNLVLRNNYIQKSCHDESIAIISNGVTEDGKTYGYVDGVVIEGNEFDIDETNVRIPSSPVINFGTSIKELSNVDFRNNTVNVKAAGGLLMIYKSTNVDISDNTFDFTLLYRTDIPELTGAIFYCESSTSQNVSAKNNTLRVRATEGTQMGYLARGFDNFYHNDVEVSAPLGAMFGECVLVDNNTLDINTADFKNYVKSYVDDEKYPFFSVYAWRDDVPEVISFTGNKITFNEQLFEHQDVRIVSVSDVDLSGTELNMSDDVIKGGGEGGDANKHMLSITGCQDTDGTSTVYALRNDSSLFNTLDVNGNDNNGLQLVIDDESVSALEQK